MPVTVDSSPHGDAQADAADLLGSKRRLAAVVSLSLAALAFISGDAAMVGVCAATRAIVRHSWPWQWFIASIVIAVGAFVFFGLPQVLAWRKGEGPSATSNPDARTRWAERLLRSGGALLFVIASLTGGPLATGWFFGRKRHPHALALTAASACLLAVAWSAVYLGVLGLW